MEDENKWTVRNAKKEEKWNEQTALPINICNISSPNTVKLFL